MKPIILNKIGNNKVILIFGTRRVGKTWPIENLIKDATICL
ncbi:hypothetical protein [Pedobacter sp. P26]